MDVRILIYNVRFVSILAYLILSHFVENWLEADTLRSLSEGERQTPNPSCEILRCAHCTQLNLVREFFYTNSIATSFMVISKQILFPKLLERTYKIVHRNSYIRSILS